jgi:hypothetical protein
MHASPATATPEYPLPTSYRQTTFGPAAGHDSAKRSFSARPFRFGPRICGQSPAEAKPQQSVIQAAIAVSLHRANLFVFIFALFPRQCHHEF